MFTKWRAALICVLFLTAVAVPGAYAAATIKIAYPGWDSKDQEKEVTSIFAAWEKQNPGV
ncbi:MAG TPA: hypothetical protein VF372_00665 [Thermodesulfobacteriota bacterium]